MRTFHLSAKSAILLAVVLLTGCNQDNPLSGHWQGEMVTQGVTVEVGSIAIGNDYLNFGDGELIHTGLEFVPDGKRFQILKKDNQAKQGEIRLISQKQARMQLKGIEGYIDLKRQG